LHKRKARIAKELEEAAAIDLVQESIREYCLRTKERLDKAPPSAAPSCFSSFWDYMNASVRDCPLRYGPVTVYGTLDGGYGYELWGTRSAKMPISGQWRRSENRRIAPPHRPRRDAEEKSIAVRSRNFR